MPRAEEAGRTPGSVVREPAEVTDTEPTGAVLTDRGVTTETEVTEESDRGCRPARRTTRPAAPASCGTPRRRACRRTAPSWRTWSPNGPATRVLSSGRSARTGSRTLGRSGT